MNLIKLSIYFLSTFIFFIKLILIPFLSTLRKKSPIALYKILDDKEYFKIYKQLHKIFSIALYLLLIIIFYPYSENEKFIDSFIKKTVFIFSLVYASSEILNLKE